MRTIDARRLAVSGAALLAAVMVSGCSGGSNPFESEPEDMYALSQSSVSCTADPATACAEVQLFATPINGTMPDYRPEWAEEPGDGRTKAVDHVYRDKQADGRWQLTVGFVTGLKAGTYSGTIKLGNLLGDILVPLPKDRKPVNFSYRVQVTADGVVKPLQAVGGAADWTGPGGTATRDGFVAVTVDPAKVKLRWSRGLTGLGTTDNDSPVTPTPLLSGGQIVLPGLRLEDSTTADNVTVLSENDGAPVWRAALTGRPNRALAAADRLVFAGGLGDGKSAALTVVARADGAVRDQVTLDTVDLGDTWALGNDSVFMPDLRGEAITARALTDVKTVRWSAPMYASPVGYGGITRWGVTASNGAVLANVGGRFRAFNQGDGVRTVDIGVPSKSAALLLNTSLYQSPVLLDASTAAIITNREIRAGEGRDNQLAVVDLAGGQTRWSQSGRFMDLPVAANGVIYASNQATKSVEARSVADGGLLWSWAMEAGDSYFQRQMVLTSGHLFVSTDKQVLAIDLASRKAVWRYGAGGLLGMSANGTLTLLTDRSSMPGRPMLVVFDVR